MSRKIYNSLAGKKFMSLHKTIISLEKRLFRKILNSNSNLFLFGYLCKAASFLPSLEKRKRNILINIYERSLKKEVLSSYPLKGNLNVTNLCNLRCKFCEIHYFYKKAKKEAGKVYPNNTNVRFIDYFSDFFSRLCSIELSGATGEPFLNPDFIPILRKLSGWKIFCSTTSNGTLITKKIAKDLVDIGFGNIVFSVHGSSPSSYFKLQNRDLAKTLKNIKDLITVRKKKKKVLPKIGVNFLLCKENVDDLPGFVKKLKSIGIDSLNVYHYYDSRNLLDKKVSFYFDQERGNKIIRELYRQANNVGLSVLPANPLLISSGKDITNDASKQQCSSPWTTIKFKGCVEFKDSYYVSVCNRILLFRLNYQKFIENGGNFFDIWNHPVIRYMRKTAGNNPICQFCQDSKTKRLRCLDNKKYSLKRDKAIKDFFRNFKKDDLFKEMNVKDKQGIYFIEKNPYEFDPKDGF